jgi:hypothetical protein
MDLRFHPHDKEYNLLRKILGTLQGVGTVDGTSPSTTVSGLSTVLDVPLTVSTSPAYEAGDSVGGLVTLSGAIRLAGKNSILHSAVLVDDDNTSSTFRLLVYSASPTGATFTDNAAAVLGTSAAQLQTIVGFDSFNVVDSKAIAAVNNIGALVKSAATDLYLALITESAPTFTSTGALTLRLGFLQD